jgi:hypothetical protein
MEYKFNSGKTLDRQPWFDCSCCPSNDVRIIASIPGYVYALKDNDLYVNLYINGSAETKIAGRKISIAQNTLYPWDGKVLFTLKPEKATEFTVKLRIPGWAVNQVLPGDLYSFSDKFDQLPEVKINGKPITCTPDKGYVSLKRKWKKGDRIELKLPMPVRRVVANPNVRDDLGKVCFIRGPITYCAEQIDNEKDVLQISVPEESTFSVIRKPDLLGGCIVLNTKSLAPKTGPEMNSLPDETELTLIPYALWNNRGANKMNVWFWAKKPQ